MENFPEDPGRAALAAELHEDRLRAGVDEHLFSEPSIQRFLDGNNGSLPDAARHFREMLQWRREKEIHANVRSPVIGKPWAVESVPGLDRLFRLMRIAIGGYTQEGHLIWVQCDGRAQIDEIMAIPEEELLRTMCMMCELRKDHLDKHSVEKGRLLKVVQVRDLSRLSVLKIIRDAALLARLRRILSVITMAYPETVHRVVLVNLPPTFSMLWSVLKSLFNERMQAKMIQLHDAATLARDLAALGGSGALEALARARGDVDENTSSIDLPAGQVAYACYRIEVGEEAEWSFEVSPAQSALENSVLFCPHGPNPVLLDVATPSPSMDICRFAAPSNGLLWFSFSNERSWTSVQILNLHIARRPNDVRRNISGHSRRNTRPTTTPPNFPLRRQPVRCGPSSGRCCEGPLSFWTTRQRRSKLTSLTPQQQRASGLDDSLVELPLLQHNGIHGVSARGSHVFYDIRGIAIVVLLVAVLVYFSPVRRCEAPNIFQWL